MSRTAGWWRPFWRRLDAIGLRWHARLDSDWSDRSLPPILAGLAFIAFAGLALARVRSLEPSEDLATWAQATWLVGQGLPARLTVVHPMAPMADLHGALVMYPVGYLVSHLPIREGLVTVQSGALAFTVLPLWRLARRVVNLRVGAAAAVVVAFCLYPPVHELNLAGFRPEALAVPALVTMVYRGLSGSRVRFGAAALLSMTCRADYALVVAAFGLLLVSFRRRRTGGVAAAGGVVWALGAIWVDWLGAGDGWLAEPGAFVRYGHSPAAVLGWFLAHPLQTASEAAGRADVAVLAALVLPLAFLPLLSLRHLAPLFPLQLLYLLGAYPPVAYRRELAVPAIALALSAAAFGLGRTGRPTAERVAVHPRVTAALLGAAVTFFLLDAPASPYAHPWAWGGRDTVDHARLTLVDQVGPDEVVAATADMLPLVAGRRVVCALPGVERCPEPPQVFLIDTELAPVPSQLVGATPFADLAGGRVRGYRTER